MLEIYFFFTRDNPSLDRYTGAELAADSFASFAKMSLGNYNK